MTVQDMIELSSFLSTIVTGLPTLLTHITAHKNRCFYIFIFYVFYVLDWVFEPESMLGVLVQVTIYNCVFGWQTELIYAEVVRSIVALLYSDMYY